MKKNHKNRLRMLKISLVGNDIPEHTNKRRRNMHMHIHFMEHWDFTLFCLNPNCYYSQNYESEFRIIRALSVLSFENSMWFWSFDLVQEMDRVKRRKMSLKNRLKHIWTANVAVRNDHLEIKLTPRPNYRYQFYTIQTISVLPHKKLFD